ncbi:MAG: efflux RND transporter permease subunit [Anaeromyxobacter sp.]|nr:efflux RND transporter permease subunit [Anaeromyxobacter sp.]MBL0275992.1 efflux RND transporter permease subunit [Anaeromyxobacter sp.]
MIDRLIEFSVRNRFLVFALAVAGCLAGWWSMRHVALDAIPDLSDTQVIIYSKWDRSPDLVEDQVTYPIVTAMLGAPKVKAVRGYSDFGYSYVYVIFEDGTDIYWARSRTTELLSSVVSSLPQGVKTELGPDATALGWVFQYVLEDTSGRHDLAELRSAQDWYLRYHLRSVPGVAEVASLGGFVQQYQVNLDPNRLRAHGIPIGRVVEAVKGGNGDAGGRLIEVAGAEYMVRGRGYARSVQDFEDLVVGGERGAPIRVKDVGQVVVGPELRRGVVDLDGTGDAVSGIVVMRQGENALQVIDRVKAKLAQVAPGLPAGVKVVPIYDRSELIDRSIDTLRSTLLEVLLTVSVVILLFLWHVPSAIIPLVTIPVAVLISFIPFQAMGITANIMSLGGIAIAIGALVDAAIVVVEQTHKRLEEWEREGRPGDYVEVIIAAVKQVGPTSFFALLVIGVSFMPVLALEDQEGRLFKPLAYTKNLAMVVAAFLAITLDPALRVTLTHFRTFDFKPRWLARASNALVGGKIHAEEHHPVSRWLMAAYEPVVAWALRHRLLVVGGALGLVLATIPVYRQLGSEFMPPLDEGALLYMPTTVPGLSIAEAQRLLQVSDGILKRFPEVDRVLGKAGRAETATDPAPLSMLETVVTLKPHAAWRRADTWWTGWAPGFLRPALRHLTPDHISPEQLVSEMNEALTLVGVSNAWTMPIKGRIEMLSTGMRTPVGLKVSGADLEQIERIGVQAEAILPSVRGTRSVFAERAGRGYFLDVEWRRDALAREGLTVDEAQMVLQAAVGGENVSTAFQGRARYPVNVRYQRDFRSDLDALGRVLVPVEGGQRHVALSQLATLRTAAGPSMIRNEDGLLTGYVYVDLAGRDPVGYVEEASALLASKLTLPAGYAVTWSGQYESQQRVARRLATVIPFTLLLVLLLLYLNTRSFTKTAIVALAVPFSSIGAIWLLWLLGYNMSVGVWVGLIALLGLDAETGVFMLLYLDLAYEDAKKRGRLRSLADLDLAVMAGAAKRLRPKFMTFATTFVGLVPILWATGTGADVMKRIAAPMVGGLFTSFVLELVVYPVVYRTWRWHAEVKHLVAAGPSAPGAAAVAGASPTASAPV